MIYTIVTKEQFERMGYKLWLEKKRKI
jgi:hypothetical protein